METRKYGTMQAYNEKMTKRNEIVRKNASLRMKGIATLPVPEKPEHPLVAVAYTKSGDYVGCLDGADVDIDPTWVIKWERAVR